MYYIPAKKSDNLESLSEEFNIIRQGFADSENGISPYYHDIIRSSWKMGDLLHRLQKIEKYFETFISYDNIPDEDHSQPRPIWLNDYFSFSNYDLRHYEKVRGTLTYLKSLLYVEREGNEGRMREIKNTVDEFLKYSDEFLEYLKRSKKKP